MKVAWFDTEKWHDQKIQTSHQIDFFYSQISLSNLDDSYDAICISPKSEITRDIMEEVRPKKVICRSSGYDHVDLDAANELGIKVQNTEGYGSAEVAEYTMSLILASAKNLNIDFGKNPNERNGTRGYTLKNKNLGVIGAGKIGKNVLKIAKGLKMNLYAYDPYKDQKAAHKIGYEYVELEELLEISDIVSVNCLLNDSTRGLLSDEEFELMEDVILVNTARGEIVETESLLKALKNDSVDKAALDVIKDDYERLEDREDVVITPHNAYNTEEAVNRRIRIVINNLDNEENIVNSVGK
jgi:D-lactate dehydrogenase